MILLLLLLLLILKKKHLIITETELGCLLKTRLLFREGELMNINTFKGGGSTGAGGECLYWKEDGH